MPKISHRYVMSGLLEGWDWFDNSLQNVLRANAYPPLNKSQSMMILYISAGVQRPTDIARKMRLSRQAIRHIAHQLVQLGLIESMDDERDKRSRRLQFTERSGEIRHFAEKVIFELEEALKDRIGAKNLSELKRILQLDWGPTISEAEAIAAKEPVPAKSLAGR